MVQFIILCVVSTVIEGRKRKYMMARRIGSQGWEAPTVHPPRQGYPRWLQHLGIRSRVTSTTTICFVVEAARFVPSAYALVPVTGGYASIASCSTARGVERRTRMKLSKRPRERPGNHPRPKRAVGGEGSDQERPGNRYPWNRGRPAPHTIRVPISLGASYRRTGRPFLRFNAAFAESVHPRRPARDRRVDVDHALASVRPLMTRPSVLRAPGAQVAVHVEVAVPCRPACSRCFWWRT